MPSTIYTATSAVAMSMGSFASDAWNAWAVPEKRAKHGAGNADLLFRSVYRIDCFTQGHAGARLKDIVTDGN